MNRRESKAHRKQHFIIYSHGEYFSAACSSSISIADRSRFGHWRSFSAITKPKCSAESVSLHASWPSRLISFSKGFSARRFFRDAPGAPFMLVEVAGSGWLEDALERGGSVVVIGLWDSGTVLASSLVSSYTVSSKSSAGESSQAPVACDWPPIAGKFPLLLFETYMNQ